MIVAARARERQAEERLRVILGDVDRVSVNEEIARRADLSVRPEAVVSSRTKRSHGMFDATDARIQS